MSDAAFSRLLRLLQLIPPHPRALDTTQLALLLAGDGFDTTARTVQRDLVKLESMGFGLECADESKPYRWRYAASAKSPLVPALDVSQALALLLVESHLSRLLPRAAWASLRGHLDAARKAVDGKPARRWLERVRVVPRTQPLQAPTIDVTILDVVQLALVEERAIKVHYKKADGTEQTELMLHPLGLLFRESVAYLVATAPHGAEVVGAESIRQYALHRMKKASSTEQRAQKPPGFDLDAWMAAGEGGWRLARDPIHLELAFYDGAERSVVESPLSTDQVVKQANEHVLVKATVIDTRVLRSWLLGFADAVEVRKPKALRDEMRAALSSAAGRYDD